MLSGDNSARTCRQAATKYLKEGHKASIADDAKWPKQLDRYIGDLPLDEIHMGTLAPFVEARKCDGVKSRTINNALKVVRRILNLAAEEWVDEFVLTWLAIAPKIKLLVESDLRKPYPLDWEEQDKLFRELPRHLTQMCLFKVNTGCREQEVCGLRWDWEVRVPELDTSVFIIPPRVVKNRRDRLVVLNCIARSVIQAVRGKHPEYVFTYDGHRVLRINNSAWRAAKARAELLWVRVHDLKHTFGRRLRAAGVSYEDR